MRTLKSLQVGMITMALLGALGSDGLAQEEVQPDMIAAAEANEAASLDAFLAQDLDAFLATYADDAVFEDLTFGDHFDSASEIREMYQALIWWTDPDTTEVLDSFVSADGSRAVAVLRWTGTSGATGRPFDLPTVVLHEYRDGKIAKESMYYAAPDTVAQLMGPASAALSDGGAAAVSTSGS
jgi:steroid delta-isomerase-like uncharacterized protein